ncbi:Hypothetical predicted protein [Cloeon dipterum]|uniref:Uncharacterized protein n=1 Tax=Cloeon dipterum TaxID=197152 RepID=A0A8S1D2K3_9INSE|nr:Hypothetical predicted protein [Cloeon dipterum]
MELAKVINAMSTSNDLPQELRENYRELMELESLYHTKKDEYLRKLGAHVESSNALDIVRDLFGKIRIEEVELNDFFEIYPQQPEIALKVLELITSTQAETLFKFSIYSPGVKNADSLPRLENAMWGEIAKLKNLKKININKRCITLADLTEMCQNMSQLRSVKFRVDYCESDLPIDRDDFASKFSNTFAEVEEFCFDPNGEKDGNETFMEELTNFCIKNLPNLALVGSETFESDMFQACMETEKESKLTHLAISARNLKEAAENVDKFPSVSFLAIVLYATKDDLNRTLSKEEKKSLKKLRRLAIFKEYPRKGFGSFGYKLQKEIQTTREIRFVSRSI